MTKRRIGSWAGSLGTLVLASLAPTIHSPHSNDDDDEFDDDQDDDLITTSVNMVTKRPEKRSSLVSLLWKRILSETLFHIFCVHTKSIHE